MFSAPVGQYRIYLQCLIAFTDKVTGKKASQALAVLKAEDKFFSRFKLFKFLFKAGKALAIVIKSYGGHNFKVAVKYSSGMRVLVGVNSHKQAEDFMVSPFLFVSVPPASVRGIKSKKC